MQATTHFRASPPDGVRAFCPTCGLSNDHADYLGRSFGVDSFRCKSPRSHWNGTVSTCDTLYDKADSRVDVNASDRAKLAAAAAHRSAGITLHTGESKGPLS